MKSASILKNIFIAVAVLELSGHILKIPEINQFSKPLLMPILLVFFKRSLKSPLNLSFLLASLALIFSWVGDVFLLLQAENSNFFIFGLASFAVAQIFFINAYLKARNLEGSISVKSKIPYTIPFFIFTVVFVGYLWPEIIGLRVPIIIYAVLLTSMAITSILRMDQTNLKSFNQVFFGSILFMFSDSLIAINKFANPMENPGLFIMLTYILAQWNIVNGLLKHYNEKIEA